MPKMRINKNKKRVVITGIGALCSLGKDKGEIWKGILEKKTGIEFKNCYIDNEYWDSFYIQSVKNFNIKDFNLDARILSEIQAWKKGENVRDLEYLLALVKLALDDSKLTYNHYNNNIGLILTHENPGLEQFYTKLLNSSYETIKNQKEIDKKNFFNKLYGICYKDAFELQSFMFLFHVAKMFQIHGKSLFINNACASGLYALETAYQQINSGKNMAVIVAGADHPDIYKYYWFKELGFYSRDDKTMPFSKKANGFILGDGGASFVLEDLDHAIRRNAIIYAEYLGSGFTLESWKVTLPAVGSNYYKKAIINALKESQLVPKNIDLVIPHGIGISITDKYEAKCLVNIFGKNKNKPFISAFKPYVGHNLGASNLLELYISLISLQKNIIPPVLYLENDKNYDLNIITKFYEEEINTLLKTCTAFAGYNGAIILRKYK